MTIDAQIEDWEGAIQRIEDERFSLGVLNDGEYLYVALVSRDQGVTSQIIRSGLTLWLDPEGGKEKVLGIRFPLGLVGSGSLGGRPTGTAGEAPRDPEVMQERFTASLSELEILAGEDERGRRLPVEGVPGLSAKAASEYGTLIYELKIPLQQSEAYSYAVGAGPGAAIGLGLETPEIDREAMRERMQGRGGERGGMGMPGGGRGSMGGGRGGMQGGGGRGAMQQAEPLKLWTSVTLAE